MVTADLNKDAVTRAG